MTIRTIYDSDIMDCELLESDVNNSNKFWGYVSLQ
jgi:hypothetical protein